MDILLILILVLMLMALDDMGSPPNNGNTI